MGADVHGHHKIARDIKNGAQVFLNVHGADDSPVLRRQTVDFVRAQAGIEGVLLEDLSSPSRGRFLGGGQIVKAFPKLFGRLEAVVHLRRRGGFAPLRTVSMSANRPASASAMPCLNSLGIHESSFSTTNLVTCARSAGGNALNPSMISCALIAVTIHKNSSLTSCKLPDAETQRSSLAIPAPSAFIRLHLISAGPV